MATTALVRVAGYRREIAGSLALAWDNVLDWEHLPWLHRQSFRSIEKRDAGAWGWRARVGLAPRREIELELLVEREAGRYVARTTAGPGAGTEIWTQLSPTAPDRTGVEVEFRVPGVRPEQAGAVGRGFVALYTRLWDEDAEMIARRAALLPALAARAAGELRLGPLADLRARLPLDAELGGRPLRVVELDGEPVAYASACPHQLGPLAAGEKPHELVCPWHGYRFDLRSRRSCDGRGLRLAPGPELRLEGPEHEVVLRWR
jgi:nitrite reductase/ring-hydroxylating ferredoxin subunit